MRTFCAARNDAHAPVPETTRAEGGKRGYPRLAPAAARVAAVCLALCGACASPLVKPAAFDPAVLAESPLPSRHLHSELDGEEIVLEESADWMRLRPEHLTFVGYRCDGRERSYCLVLECLPEQDRLTLLPLAEGETSLSVLGDPERRAQLGKVLRRYALDRALPPGVETVSIALREAIDRQLLGPPIPDPKRVLAVVANYPSHLQHDLASDPESIPLIAQTPPRLFQKHPPQAPPGIDYPSDLPFRGVIGPFDSIVYPDRTWLPKDESGVSNSVPTALDYEVELGAVIGRTLTWDDVKEASDEEIYAAIAGFVLVSDVKARNPQVYERALTRAQSPDEWAEPYLTGDADIDLVLGNWTPDTVAWWGYAASLGDFTAIGPYFVANEGATQVPPTALVCARSYAPNESRHYPIPGGRSAGRLYLRQCSRATEAEGAPDSMVWHVPQIVRAALDPGGALAPTHDATRLQPGDVIALGTPGGITLTVSGRAFYRFLGSILFWWDALDWHDAFFGKDVANYLHHGDRLFLWGEGLGCQHLTIRQITWPPPPGVEPSPDDPALQPESLESR
jgi:2-keto-4-pentenoate hydratase/2-oxohepta-3-ene-1,7-dioic acid hydratase in catechol pathway